MKRFCESKVSYGKTYSLMIRPLEYLFTPVLVPIYPLMTDQTIFNSNIGRGILFGGMAIT